MDTDVYVDVVLELFSQVDVVIVIAPQIFFVRFQIMLVSASSKVGKKDISLCLTNFKS